MINIGGCRALGGALGAAAIVLVAGCSSQSAGIPAAPSTLGQNQASGTATPAADHPVHGVAPTTSVADDPVQSTAPAQTPAPPQTVTVTGSATADSPRPDTTIESTTPASGPASTAAEVSAPTDRTISIVTARVSAFDPATGRLSYVLQVRNHPTDLAPYYSDDPADSAEHQAMVTPDAPIRFVFSSCTLPYGELHEGGIACTPDDLAAAAAHGGFLASLDIVNSAIETVTQIFQS